MELISFIFACVAIFFFLARKDIPVGLSALTVAWVIQLILNWVQLEVTIK